MILCEEKRSSMIGLQSRYKRMQEVGRDKVQIEEMSNEEHVFLVVEF